MRSTAVLLATLALICSLILIWHLWWAGAGLDALAADLASGAVAPGDPAGARSVVDGYSAQRLNIAVLLAYAQCALAVSLVIIIPLLRCRPGH